MARGVSSAGSAALGENGKSRPNNTADGGLGDAREVLGKYAAVGEFDGVIGPGQAQPPGLFGFLGAGDRDFADGDLEERLEAPVECPNAFAADEELHGSRRRPSGLITPSIDDKESSQFAGLVVGVGIGFAGRQKNGADEHGQTDDGRNEASPPAERQDDQRCTGDSQEYADEHPRARVASLLQVLWDKQPPGE